MNVRRKAFPPSCIGDWLKLSSGNTKPSDMTIAPSDKNIHPVFGGNGIMGYSSKNNASGMNIIIGRVGANCGCVHIYNGDCWITDNALYTIEKKKNYDALYVATLLNFIGLKKFSSKGGQPLITQKPIHTLLVEIPATIKEQTAIAKLFSTWDQAIEKTERLIAAKEKWLKILQQKLIFIPSQNNKQFRHCKIEDISHRIQRKSDGKEYPILTISSASGFVLQKEKYSRFMAGKSLEDYILLKFGEFAYNKGNSLRYQFGCIFPLQEYEAALVPHVYVCFKLHDYIDSDYVSHVFKADYLRKQLGALVNTGIRTNGLLNISPDTFMKVTIPLPKPEKQIQIASILNTAEKEIDLLKKQLDAYRRQKRGIVQKLLTGQWRVKITEERSSNG